LAATGLLATNLGGYLEMEETYNILIVLFEALVEFYFELFRDVFEFLLVDPEHLI
jgi:hypothetical protein